MTHKIPVLVVGVGSIGERHVRCFSQTNRACVSICEPLAARRQQVAASYPVDHVYESMDQALEHADDFDAAIICVPAHLHIPCAMRLAEAGKHLLIEKPLSTAETGVERLQQIVTARQLVAGVAYVYRHHPALQAMRQAIQAGRIGPPVELVATCGQHFPTYRPAYAEIYYRAHETGGGAIQDALTHIVNAGQWLLGPIHRLAADAAHQVLPGVSVEDTVHMIARHGTVPAVYSLNQHQAPNEVTLTVHGQHGTARFEGHAQRWRWMTDPGSTWHDEPIGALERDSLFIRQAVDFLDGLQQRRTPACSLAEARQTLRVNLAILAAARSGQWQHIAPEHAF